jgi:hypothetical protein
MTEKLANFNKDGYMEFIGESISKIMLKPSKDIITYDILDSHKSKKYKLIALKEKQRQMKVGEIWQIVLGNYKDFRDLKVGDKTGLDIINDERKIIIELKNRTNTDNSASKKTNLDKLAKFKKR